MKMPYEDISTNEMNNTEMEEIECSLIHALSRYLSEYSIFEKLEMNLPMTDFMGENSRMILISGYILTNDIMTIYSIYVVEIYCSLL